ncbi:hypothetical protein BDV32DRAFT_24197 [Aspergillus pseudonomiae]|uniref:Uncharacterized protein n=1 Tax=Aspergillus pseudonomiae TaxID=1506151 RepID=A0A5N6I6W7_9EURO|nr:uncharacterized protein BDV37DRAFT_241586 [Aspergillus pseudonomiae]KAB8262422.1 hypothetical protein BDV32DRAFT_24197 [Aspergillus pseudonomiae]KAE8406970.1 hypothetical protein BDV37DRAFT_241586 [Aspergillus pseudonomiae]
MDQFESLVADRTAISLRRNGPSVFYHVLPAYSLLTVVHLLLWTVMQVPGRIRNWAMIQVPAMI